jgi:hypothetical protein
VLKPDVKKQKAKIKREGGPADTKLSESHVPGMNLVRTLI